MFRMKCRMDKYLPFKIILAFELAWLAIWFAFVIWMQVQDDSFGWEGLRRAHIFLAFHFVSLASLISLLETPVARFGFLTVFLFSIAFATDLWSVLDIFLHVSHIIGIDASGLAALQGISIIAIILSGACIVIYTCFLVPQITNEIKAKSDLEEYVNDKEDLFEQLVTARGKINHQIKR